MNDTQLNAFKNIQKESWSLFAPLEIVTTIPAAKLVKFSGVAATHSVLDVGCGTGVVAITAAKLGAQVSAIDLCPALIKQATDNIDIANVDVKLKDGDIEALPYENDSFDVVLSQFGHMFSPRPQVAIQEMLRVLKPGGIIAFSTWPPDLYVGRLFLLTSKYSPPPITISSPTLWGDTHFIREQLGNAVNNIIFDIDMMSFPALSLGHYRRSIETTVGPIVKFVKDSQDNPALLKQFRDEVNALALEYYKDNYIQQHYLMTRAIKK